MCNGEDTCTKETNLKLLKGLTSMPKTMVMIQPPTNPSTVFLGDNLIRGVLPQKKPKMYAQISLAMTSETGRKNQIRPSKILLIMK